MWPAGCMLSPPVLTGTIFWNVTWINIWRYIRYGCTSWVNLYFVYQGFRLYLGQSSNILIFVSLMNTFYVSTWATFFCVALKCEIGSSRNQTTVPAKLILSKVLTHNVGHHRGPTFGLWDKLWPPLLLWSKGKEKVYFLSRVDPII